MKQVAMSGSDAVASRPDAKVDEHEIEERRRGFEDGTVWASDFATADELRDFVENSQARSGSETAELFCDVASEGESSAVHRDSYFGGPYWEGFIEGAEEVLSDSRS